MHKAKLIRSFMFVVLLMTTGLVLPENAMAARAIGNYSTAYPNLSCASCHNPLATSSKKKASAAKIQAAINNGTGGMGVFSILTPAQVDDIAVQLGSASTCVSPKTWDTTGKVCAAPPAVICTLPLVRDAATNTCVAPPAVVCASPLVRDAATNTCVAPPAVACAAPLVRDAVTNTCATPPAVACTLPLVRDAATNTCVTPPAVVCTQPLVRDAATNTCVTQPPVNCILPKKLVNGVCTMPSPAGSKDKEKGDDFGHKYPKTGKYEKHVAQSGTVGLENSGAAKTDVYAVICAAGTSRLSVSVRDLAPVKAPLISIQASKDASSSALTTDTVDGDAVDSPSAQLAKGPGIYTVQVNKSASSRKGSETYVAQINCQNAAGIQTGTQLHLKQNH
jgi:hypothetical protein